jgi:cell division septation protein DedD
MEDQTTWKGHSFTLLVFTGIVVLCSIFFILGMLVGRTQGQKIATVAAAAGEEDNASARRAAEEDATAELKVYESAVGEQKPQVLEQRPSKPEPLAAPPSPEATVLNYQIVALRKSSDAEKVLDEIKKKGFRAFILAPAAGDANPLFRVQVGPFSDMGQAEQVKNKLESAGYRPILKK